MGRTRKGAAADLTPCRALSLNEAVVLLLVSRQQAAQPLAELHRQAPALRRYELAGHLDVLGVLRLVILGPQGYHLQPGPRTDAALSQAWAQVQAAHAARVD